MNLSGYSRTDYDSPGVVMYTVWLIVLLGHTLRQMCTCSILPEASIQAPRLHRRLVSNSIPLALTCSLATWLVEQGPSDASWLCRECLPKPNFTAIVQVQCCELAPGQHQLLGSTEERPDSTVQLSLNVVNSIHHHHIILHLVLHMHQRVSDLSGTGSTLPSESRHI